MKQALAPDEQQKLATIDVPESVVAEWDEGVVPGSRENVACLIESTVSTAAGLRKKVYWDCPSGLRGKKQLVARRMHNKHLSNNDYATFKGLNLPKNGLKIRVNKLADGSGHVLLSIEPPAALQLEVLGVWDTRTNDIVVQPLAVVA